MGIRAVIGDPGGTAAKPAWGKWHKALAPGPWDRRMPSDPVFRTEIDFHRKYVPDWTIDIHLLHSQLVSMTENWLSRCGS